MSTTALELKKPSALESTSDAVSTPTRSAADPSTSTFLATEDLPYWSEQWLLEGECRLHSARTIETRRIFLRNFLWFLRDRQIPACDTTALRRFFAYLSTGHQEPGGRWGNPQLTQPLRPISIKDYHCCLRHFFTWLEQNAGLTGQPLVGIPIPIVRADHKPPLSPDQIQALLQAARNGSAPLRDEAILMFLLDTGVRASELVTLTMKNVDIAGRRCRVLGKGNKHRTVFLGRQTARVLARYVRKPRREDNDPVFLSGRSGKIHEPLTRSGLQQIIRRRAKAAGIHGPVSPHALRRTFAVEILKNGANVFSLREMLGHTNLQMTQKYLLLAQADVEAQHRQYSPADSLCAEPDAARRDGW